MNENRITAVRATPVNVPLEAPYRWAPGVVPGFSKTIVEVETSEGITGIGEAATHRASTVIERTMVPRLLGADPYDIGQCEHRCLPPIHTFRNVEDNSVVHAWGGIEMALWDVVGKLESRSVASLLGGRIKETIPFTEYFAFRLCSNGRGGERTPVDIARYCARMAEQHGARSFEGKMGVAELGTEIAMVKEIRSAVGYDATLRLDANMAWTTITAREALRRLEPYEVSSLEEPVRSLQEMARLRPSTTIGFSSHDASVREAALLGVPDAFVIGLTVLGGIRRTLAFIGACEHLGIDVWFYSPDAGIANAAYLQVASAVDWLHQPNQTLLRWHLDDVIEEGPFQPENGSLRVPEGPGLGVTLDSKALKRCFDRFRDQGPYDVYGAGVDSS